MPQDGVRPAGLPPGLPAGIDAGNGGAGAAAAAGTASLGQLDGGSDLLEKVGTGSEGAVQENAGDGQARRGSWGCGRQRAIPVSH